MDNNNTYYSCECVYFEVGFISCKICSQWIQNTFTAETKLEPVNHAKRWCQMNRDYSQNSKNMFSINNIVSTDLTSTKK